MKKIACIGLAALSILACQREVDTLKEEVPALPTHTVTIRAGFDTETKTTYSAEGKFSWVAGDQIDVVVSNGTVTKRAAFKTEETGPQVQFSGEVEEGFELTGLASYSVVLSLDQEKNAWCFSGNLFQDDKNPLSDVPLFGFEDVNHFYQFKTAGGILKFTVENIPEATCFGSLETFGDGAPALRGYLSEVPADGVVTMSALSDGANDIVVDAAPEGPNTTLSYFFFVPAGTLPAEKTKFCLLNAGGECIDEFVFKKDVEVAANRITNVAPIVLDPVKIYNRQSDSLALVAIYNAANGATWKEERRWDLSKPIDQWDGVKLTDGRVTTLAITASGVITSAWTMPKEVGNLSELTVLKFNQCKLTGELPEEVFNLTKLTDLYFQSNDLTGTFSDKYTQLTSLKNLYINNNKNLGGSLPASIGQLTKLESINIAQTKFSGTIPAELALCTSLKNIMAWSNNLSGEIPDFWDKLPNVGVIQFYGNPDITGPIPSTMGTLKKATGIQLKECNLTGNIPASFGGLEKCGNLQLNGNKLSGVVPAEVQAHPKWQATSGWKYETNILPQQDGYGLTTE